MCSSVASFALALVLASAALARAQGGAADDAPAPPPAPPAEDMGKSIDDLLNRTAAPAPPPAAPVPEPPPTEPAPTEPAPTASRPEPKAPPSSADASVKEDSHIFRARGVILGIEAGIAAPSGTSATVYDRGFGTGLVIGYRYDRLTLEWHFLQHYALSAKDEALRGETTLGTLVASSALAGVRVLDAPVVVSVMGGPAMLTMPIFVVTAEIGGATPGTQLIEARGMNGVGLIAGASVGFPITPRIDIGVDVRKILAARWELPSNAYVVPGGRTSDGNVMYTTSAASATGSATTATIILRVLL